MTARRLFQGGNFIVCLSSRHMCRLRQTKAKRLTPLSFRRVFIDFPQCRGAATLSERTYGLLARPLLLALRQGACAACLADTDDTGPSRPPAEGVLTEDKQTGAL